MGDVLKSAYLRSKAAEYLQHFIGFPYLWGGNDPMSGFDCSGLIVEVLQAVGIIPNKSDYTAAALYERFDKGAIDRGYMGCLVFWYGSDKKEKIIHVEMMIDDFHTVGASGGGSRTTSLAAAIAENAFIKMRPLSYRGERYLIADPFKVEDE